MRAADLKQFDWFKFFGVEYMVLGIRDPGAPDDKTRFQAEGRSGAVSQFEFQEDEELEFLYHEPKVHNAIIAGTVNG